MSADNHYQQPPSFPSHHGTGQWTGEGYDSPANYQGQPVLQHATYNRMPPRPPLGPPPSARKGPSSYYAHVEPVHPIVEESESARFSNSRTSQASSVAIPIGIPTAYLDGRESGISMAPSSIYPDESPPRPVSELRPFKQRMQENNASDYFPPQEDTDPRGESPSNAPVRQASLGKRSKPTLTTVKSGERIRQRGSVSSVQSSTLPSQQRRVSEVMGPRAVSEKKDVVSGADRSIDAYEQESPTAPVAPANALRPNTGDTSFLDSSSESARSQKHSNKVASPDASVRAVKSKERMGMPQKPQQARVGRSPLAVADDDDDNDDALSKEILADPEKRRELVREDSDTLKSPEKSFSEGRAGMRRPPRLDVDAIRDEEARGSLTSLSDLIKRATRLASNLDRGRTASRLGMEHWLNGSNNNSAEHREKQLRHASANSLSDILASFPPPGAATPTPSEARGLANWGSSRRHSRPLPSDSDAASHTRRARRPRRCCGIPLWLFLLLLAVLLLLIAAATVIPIVLIVLPNQQKSSSGSSASTSAQLETSQAATAPSSCPATLVCQNGGQAFPVASSSSSSSSDEPTCRCLCANPYTGPTCSTRSTAACASLALPSMSQNATVGSAIPRLLRLAEDSFALRLDAQALLGLFSEAGLECAEENALVTFGGKAVRRLRLRKRQDGAATLNGVVYDGDAEAPRPRPGSGSGSGSAEAGSSSDGGEDGGGGFAAEDVDFARVAVLKILLDSERLEVAEAAQGKLQGAVDGGVKGVVEVGGGWVVDFGGRSVRQG